MDEDTSFGYWVRQRRRTLDLTQDELARRAGCATISIRKIEQDERRPSREIAERLAVALELGSVERETFVSVARAECGVARLEATPAQARSTLTATHPADPHPAVLPTGTVTFLFTDIVSSTRMWERHGETMPGALTRHDALLRAAIVTHHGTIVKQTGDGVHAAFAHAADAVATALAAQRALLREAWGDVAVRVRMALHSGATDERGGDFFGPVVNRAARLLAVAHGSQILLSRATAELVEEQLPPGVTLRELGQHHLRDLTRPEHIVQLVAPDLPADFPPLKTVDNHPNNLPVQRDPLIGREHELAAVAELIARNDVGLVTLTGPGGIGKTRLAQQVAATVLPTFADGAWFVDLAPISDPTLVAATIGTTLNLKEAQDQPMAEHLAAFLRDKHVLLVLDNFEQVVDAAPLVARLLTAAPRLKVLVTSRTALRVRGERLVAVPPLAVPDPRQLPSLDSLSEYAAVELFLRRAQAVRSDLELTSDNAAAVAGICVQLDGLPLAIELAAARSTLLPLRALLARLDNRLKLLTEGARDQAARQQTLRNTIDWSYDLLGGGEQMLFARLSVFPGGATFEAVEAVCNARGDLPGDLFEGLGSLLDNSLLQHAEGRAGEPRFAMLTVIREYAWERLQASGEAEALQQYHAHYYQALVERVEPKLRGPEQRLWLDELEVERDNLRAVLQWSLQQEERAETALHLAVTLWRFWTRRTYLSEGRRWLEAALKAGGTVQPALQAKALCCACMLARLQGDYPRATALCEAGLALYRELEDRWGIAVALNDLGRIAASQGEYGRARALLEETLALRRALGDRSLIAFALDGLGNLATKQGEYARAQALHEESLALRQSQSDTRDISASLRHLGRVALLQGDYARAETLLEESLKLLRELGAKQDVGAALRYLGRVALLRGDYARAEMLLEESLQLLRVMGTKADIAGALHTVGVVKLAQGDDTRARTLFKESLLIRLEIRNQVGIAECIEGFAVLAAGKEQHHGAGRLDAWRVALLLGAAAALRAALGAPLPPVDRPAYDHHLAAARARLDEATWTAAWAEGQNMSLDQVIAYALETSVAS